VRCLSDPRDLTARIELGAVCGRLLKYALLLAENHHHFAGKPNQAAQHAGVYRTLLTPQCEAQPDSYNSLMLDLSTCHCLHKAVCNLLVLKSSLKCFAPLLYSRNQE